MPKKKTAPSRSPRQAASGKKQEGGAQASSAARGAESSEVQKPAEGVPVVGVGASAGGLNAFRELLQHLPVDTGMAFVLVQHLDPHHESLLTSLLARATPMPVREVRDNMRVEPNAVYVIPPNADVGILHDHLHLMQPESDRARHLPVDRFLNTLAEDRGRRSIGVILSGTASDGTLGLKAVKAAGGVTFAQDEVTAEYFGMPGSAVAAGCVDFVLSPRDIAREIGRIAHHPLVLHERAPEGMVQSTDQLNKVFLLLRTRTGHDFTYYKHTTINRRINRRMLVHKLTRFADYIRLLEQNPAEVDALFQDIVINVTAFFRDPEAFEALQREILPKLLSQRRGETPLRIWVPGCATGEEAYTLAISLLELMGDHNLSNPVQIFGTDIDRQAVEKARLGIFAERIVDELGNGRLKRFFVKVAGGYQVSKPVRDMCIFAEQDVIKDAPFSKLDLVCCRNLLIYFGAALQKRVLQIFHYALKPTGYLMLGTSETIGSHADLFRLVDMKNKIYARKSAVAPVRYEFTPRLFTAEDTVRIGARAESGPAGYDLHQEAERVLLDHYAPPGVVINHDMDILHFRGETGPYLNPAPGSASLNLLKMARQELAVELRAAVHKVGKEGRSVRKEGIRMRGDGYQRIVDLQVIPLSGPVADERCMLVLFEEAKVAVAREVDQQSEKPTAAERGRIYELEQELAAGREYMQSIIEGQEATNEELKSANEEIQSTNEELQSTNEELETAKEELQSTNEELATVNEELENRNAELGAANNDMTNLLASSNLSIVMLDHDLRIRQFTQQGANLFNLIDSDIGRPIGQIRANINLPELEQMVSEVIESMVIRSLEVQDRDGHWYDLRVRPYKTVDKRIEGAVLAFVDIDNIKDFERLQAMQDALLATERQLQAILDNSATLIYTKDLEGRYQVVNRRLETLFGIGADAVIGRTDHEVFPRDLADAYRAHDRQVVEQALPQEFDERVRLDDGDHTFLAVKFPIRGANGAIVGVGGIATDITQRDRERQQLQRLATVVRDANDAITVQDLDGNIQAWNPAAERMYGWSEHEALGMNIRDLVPEAERATMVALSERVRNGETPAPVEVTRLGRAGDRVRVRLTLSLLLDARGRPKAFATTEQELLADNPPG